MKKKICIIADAIDEQYAGVYTYASEFIRNIVKFDSRHDIQFVHSKRNSFFNGLNHRIIPCMQAIPLWATFRKFYVLPRFLRKSKFDLVHELTHIASFSYADFPGKKIITIYDLTPVIYPKWHKLNSVIIHRKIFPRILKKADRIIAISKATAVDIKKYCPDHAPINVVYCGVKKLNESIERKKEFPFILFVSTIEPRKNIVRLIDAYEKIRKNGHMEKLVMIGRKGWKCGEIMRRIKNSSFKDDIIMLGYRNEEEISWYYKNASLFVYPSLYEGFGLPILEAMKNGCPVVASNVSSIPEVVGNAGLLFNPMNSGDIYEKMSRVLLDESIANSYSEKGLIRTELFNWENCAKKISEIYDEVIEE